ncbi:spore coat U domain-containing protein [Pseudomonas sp. JS3066]|jgi:spore coat protein U-like protein|uniref:Csu type fimbrial protein n=1 Tax=unclassified Pseudomonas TaxID=196821 RepID=UPI002E7B6AB9|nr:spore coat U domain-containing protein [Pseudomonas sp. JS3066]WVK93962.1 spore coat U domain-containing protein [Pseudomonas sp. JS3066]
MRGIFLFALLALAPPLAADTGTNELTVQQSFQIQAVISSGCLLGSGASDATSFGSLSFGQFATLPADVNQVTTPGGGSIILQCTPGLALTIALSAGANTSNVSSGRLLAKGAETLRYQLYKDAGYSAVWGDGSNGATAMSLTFPVGGTSQTFPVYARLFSTAVMPSAGIYTDTVTVTITY